MGPRKCEKLDETIISSGLLNSVDYIMTDCDGVLWLGNDAIPGSVEVINALKDMGKHIIYVTNNSTKSREEYLTKCRKLGFPATLDSIISTSYCAATYLKSMNFNKKVYIFGSTGISGELENANIEYLPIGPDPVPDEWISWVHNLTLDPEVGAVIVGFDQYISYSKLTKAASYLRSPDVLFIATNRDEQFPSGNSGLTMPGTGTFVVAIEAVSGRKAQSLGKPERYMLDCIKQTFPAIDFNRCIMIGDRLNTDILLGTRNGIKTLLVLTGISSLEEVREHQKSSDSDHHLLVPDYYLPCLGDMLPLLKS